MHLLLIGRKAVQEPKRIFSTSCKGPLFTLIHTKTRPLLPQRWKIMDEQRSQRLLQLTQLDGNKTCVDCDAPHPQWASVNNGVFFCLECSGIHRSLGVQTSFVRSVTMDNWTDDQIRKMEIGGNLKAIAFWKSRPDYLPSMNIREKYNSNFGKQYRDKLKAEFEGKPWTLASSASTASVLVAPPLFKANTASNASFSSQSSGSSIQSNAHTPHSPNETNAWFDRVKGYASDLHSSIQSLVIEPATAAVKNSAITKNVTQIISSQFSTAPDKQPANGTQKNIQKNTRNSKDEDDDWSW